MPGRRSLKDFFTVPAHIISHILIISVSAAAAWYLPTILDLAGSAFSISRAMVGNDKIFLLAVEIIFAALLILLVNYSLSVFKDRRFSMMARQSGMIYVSFARGFFSRWNVRKLKEQQCIGRDVMVIGSTGARTFSDDNGDLHTVIRNCREAKIMLLNPYSEGAELRAKSIQNPDITPDSLQKQIQKSINFLKELRAAQKKIGLKLYSDVPFMKMTISGDYIWLKHYHPGIDVQSMPEFIFRHTQNNGSLYAFFYQHFVRSWSNHEIPEYDLETDELIYRDVLGNELRRTPLRAFTQQA